MKVTLDTMVGRVKVALGRNAESRELFESLDCENMRIEWMIEQLLPDMAIRVIEEAPLEKLGDCSHFGDAVRWVDTPCGTLYGGTVPLPHDFLRLVSFRMDDWQHAVNELTPPLSLDAELQHSPEPGLRGNPESPRCFITPHASGWMLAFNACNSTEARIAEALYIPLPIPDKAGAMRIPRLLIGDVVRVTAAEVSAQLAAPR